MTHTHRIFIGLMIASAVALASLGPAVAEYPSEIRVDWATYNPTSMVLRENGWLEEDLAKDGIGVRWVQSHGSNKALEFLNAGSIDFGSTAGAAALLGRINGNPIKAIYVYSKPEWTALVTRPDTGISTVEQLEGKRIAVTRGTDPHIFLVQALARHGLTSRDVRLVLLQHAHGGMALQRGDVDAWAGLDPMMAQAELDGVATLFYRDPDANTLGILNARVAFLEKYPALVDRVLAAYERARRWSLENPEELKALLAGIMRLPEPVVAKQLERNDLTNAVIGPDERTIIEAAGLALQDAGLIRPEVDVPAAVVDLVDDRFTLDFASVQ